LKNQRLERALSNASINSVKHYTKHCSRYQVDSTDLVKKALLNFRRNMGCYITNCSMIDYPYHGKNEEGEKQFREAFSQHIHELIGQEPRIAMAANDYAIYYS